MPCAIPPIDQTSARVGRGYGLGWNRERTSDEQLHGGMDFVADSGAPVLAPIPGRVLFLSDNSGPRISATQAQAGTRGQVRRMGGYGNSVVLEHDLDVPGLPRPFWTSYNHLQVPATLSPGQSVNTGDLLGRVGNTTNNQFRGMGAHLHMEVRRAAFPGPVGRDSYELDTVDPSALFSALGIDWVDSHREVGRGVGGQLLIRTGGPSDCPTTLSGLGQPCCGRRRSFGVLPSPSSGSTGTHVPPERVRAKYATKGATTKSVSETSAALLPPDYPEAVDEAAPPTNVLPWIAGGVVVALLGAALWKRNRSGLGMQPRDPYAHDIRDLVRDYQLLANDMREEAQDLRLDRRGLVDRVGQGHFNKNVFQSYCSSMKRNFIGLRDSYQKVRAITNHQEWPNVVRHFQDDHAFKSASQDIDDAIITSNSAKVEYERLGCTQAFEPWLLPATIR